MAKGVKTGGRQRGSKNKQTAEREEQMQAAAALIGTALGEDAFDGDAHTLLMAIYKDKRLPLKSRLDAAIAAIGYEKPRLSSIDANIDGQLGHYEAQPIPTEARHSDAVASPNGSAVNGHSA